MLHLPQCHIFIHLIQGGFQDKRWKILRKIWKWVSNIRLLYSVFLREYLHCPYEGRQFTKRGSELSEICSTNVYEKMETAFEKWSVLTEAVFRHYMFAVWEWHLFYCHTILVYFTNWHGLMVSEIGDIHSQASGTWTMCCALWLWVRRIKKWLAAFVVFTWFTCIAGKKCMTNQAHFTGGTKSEHWMNLQSDALCTSAN